MPDIGLPMRITLEGWTGFYGMQAMMTSISVGSDANAQFLHSLRRFVHVYVFGERIGEVMIGGLAATYQPCGFDEDQLSPVHPGNRNARTGFERVFDFYDRFRLSALGRPIDLVLGVSIRLKLFLTSFKLDHHDPNNGLAIFTLAGRSAVFSLDGGRPAPRLPPLTTAIAGAGTPPVTGVSGRANPPAPPPVVLVNVEELFNGPPVFLFPPLF